MTHPNRRRGNDLERLIVNTAKERGLKAQRAYASNGQSLGMHEEVDCLIEGLKVQAKRRKSIAAHLVPSEHVDVVAVRPDRGQTLYVVPEEMFLSMLACKSVLSTMVPPDDT